VRTCGDRITGQLIILGAGDESLYTECVPLFDKLGKKALYLGAVGAGARMKLVVNMIMGTMMGAFSEGMALAEQV
jgi:glyoxylate/succinic semialdehyde reductase